MEESQCVLHRRRPPLVGGRDERVGGRAPRQLAALIVVTCVGGKRVFVGVIRVRNQKLSRRQWQDPYYTL